MPSDPTPIADELDRLSTRMSEGHEVACAVYTMVNGRCDCGYERACFEIIEVADNAVKLLREVPRD